MVEETPEALHAELEACRRRLAELEAKNACDCGELRMFEQLVRFSPDILVILNTDGSYRYVNQRFLDFYGLTQDQVRGRHISEIIGKEYFETHIKERLGDCLAGTPTDYYVWREDAGGERRCLHIKGEPLLGASSGGRREVQGAVVSIRDVTEMKTVHEELKLAQVIVENSPAILFRRRAGDPPKLEFVSDNIRKLGYTPDDFYSGRISFADIVHPDDNERLRKEISEHTETGRTEYVQEYRVVTPQGREIWLDDKTVAVTDADSGEITHYQGILVDITERKLAEAALMESEEKYRRILETTGEGFLLMDPDFHIIEVNDAFAAMLGRKKGDFLGKRPWDFSDEQSKRLAENTLGRFSLLEGNTFESRLVHKDGHVIPVLGHANMLRDAEGRVVGRVSFMADISDMKKAMALAEEVQKSLFPTEAPPVSGFDVAGRCLPCDGAGGDYYDYFMNDHGCADCFTVAVGDVAGHGVDAALLMTMARGFLRMRASQPGASNQVMDELNRHLTADLSGSGRFMTMFYMTVDAHNNAVSWVRAGHDPALVYSPDSGRFEELLGEGLPLGILENFAYQENRHAGLAPGQVVAIGTDGIWEARSLEGEMFGKERFRALIREHAGATATAILDAVYAALDAHIGGRRPEDDVTMVVVKVL